MARRLSACVFGWPWSVAVPAGASSALQLSDDAGWLLAVPILIAAICAGAILTSAARGRAGGCSEGCTASLGVLLTATLLAAGVYEVLLYELLFCAQGHGEDFTSLPGTRGVYCGFLSRSGYWPAFVPAIVVLLTSIVALERGPRPLVLASVAAMAWSVLFGLLPLVWPSL